MLPPMELMAIPEPLPHTLSGRNSQSPVGERGAQLLVVVAMLCLPQRAHLAL